MTDNTLTMSAGHQALIALGALGVAGYLVTTTAGTLLDNDFGALDLSSAPEFEISQMSERQPGLQGLVEFANVTNPPIEFTQEAQPEQEHLLMQEIELANPRSPLVNTNYSITTLGFGLAAREERIESEQARLLNILEQQAINSASRARNVLQSAGLRLNDINVVVDDVPNVATLVSYNSNDPEFEDRVAQVSRRIAENNQLLSVLVSAPLAIPVARELRRTSGFGTRHDPIDGDIRFHRGQDLAGPIGTPILSTASGTVSFAGQRSGYGNTIEIEHGNGFMTRYGHLSRIEVAVGDQVNEGSQIGRLGNSGRSTGAHLHYEIWYNGRPMDPKNFMAAGVQIHTR